MKFSSRLSYDMQLVRCFIQSKKIQITDNIYCIKPLRLKFYTKCLILDFRYNQSRWTSEYF